MVVYRISGSRVLINLTANATYVVAGNDSVSNVASNGEIVESAAITKVFWTGNGVWQIARGANVVMNLHGSGEWDLRQFGMTLNQFPAANLVVTNSSNGTLLIELTKISNKSGTVG